jgi:hypothetical protein
VKAYQNKIEALLKQGLDPESEGVRKLVSEMEALKARKEELGAATETQKQKEAHLAAETESAADALEREVAIGAATAAAIGFSVKQAAAVFDMAGEALF